MVLLEKRIDEDFVSLLFGNHLDLGESLLSGGDLANTGLQLGIRCSSQQNPSVVALDDQGVTGSYRKKMGFRQSTNAKKLGLDEGK